MHPKVQTLEITIAAALDMAQFQRPGRRIILGAEQALDAPVEPLSDAAIRALPGPSNFAERDFPKAQRTSSIKVVEIMAHHLAKIRCEPVTEAHIATFSQPHQSLDDWKAILRSARAEMKAAA